MLSTHFSHMRSFMNTLIEECLLILSRKPENKLPFQKPTSISEVIKTYLEEGREVLNWINVTQTRA
jgi:hypothetical protein